MVSTLFGMMPLARSTSMSTLSPASKIVSSSETLIGNTSTRLRLVNPRLGTRRGIGI